MDDWEKFQRNYNHVIDEIKPVLKITLYGSYHPDDEMEFLRTLQGTLVNEGYIKTVLVVDRMKPHEDILEVSQQSMLFSDINLLIFTRTGKRHGLVDEFAFLTSDSRMIDKIQFSLVVDLQSEQKSAVPPMSQRRVEKYAVELREFKSKQELIDKFARSVYWIMRRWARRYYGIP